MGIFPEPIRKEALRWTREAKDLSGRRALAAGAKAFVAGQRSLELRVQALAAWRGQVHRWDRSLAEGAEGWKDAAPDGSEVSPRRASADRPAWMGLTRPPWHRQVREAAAWSFADAAPVAWLQAEWDEVVSWGRTANPELVGAALRALERLAVEAPAWTTPRWKALLAGKSVRDNALAVSLLFEPLGRASLAESLETVLSVGSTLNVGQAQDLGLRLEAGLRHWPAPRPPLQPAEAKVLAAFLDRLLVEARDLYFVGHQDRSLLLTAIDAGCQAGWPRASVDALLQSFRQRPAEHIHPRDWWRWGKTLIRFQLWEDAALVLQVARQAGAGTPGPDRAEQDRLEGLLRQSKGQPEGVLETGMPGDWPQAVESWRRERMAFGVPTPGWRHGEGVMSSVRFLESVPEIPPDRRPAVREQMEANRAFLATTRYWQGWRDHERWRERVARQMKRASS